MAETKSLKELADADFTIVDWISKFSNHPSVYAYVWSKHYINFSQQEHSTGKKFAHRMEDSWSNRIETNFVIEVDMINEPDDSEPSYWAYFNFEKDGTVNWSTDSTIFDNRNRSEEAEANEKMGTQFLTSEKKEVASYQEAFDLIVELVASYTGVKNIQKHLGLNLVDAVKEKQE